MKLLGHILAAALSLTLSTAILVLILAHTIGDPAILQQAVNTSKLPDQLATQLPSILASSTTSVAPTHDSDALTDALTPDYLNAKISELLPQLVQHLRDNGPVPTLNLADLPDRLAAAGYPLDTATTNQLSTPISVTLGPADRPITDITHSIVQLEWIAPLLSLVLIALIIILMRDRRWPTLARSFLLTAIGTALTAGLLFLTPGLIQTTLNAQPDLRLLIPPLLSLTQTIIDPIIRYHLIATGLLFFLAAVIFFVYHLSRIKTRLQPIRSSNDKTSNNPPQIST